MRIAGTEWLNEAVAAHRKGLESQKSRKAASQARLELDAERTNQKQRAKRRDVVDALKSGEDAGLRAAESEKKARTGKGAFYAKG